MIFYAQAIVNHFANPFSIGIIDMENNKQLYRILFKGSFYNAFQAIVGANYTDRWLLKNFWKISDGEKIVDMGCGTGKVFSIIDKRIDYIGFDYNYNYINIANYKYGDKATFFVGTSELFLQTPRKELLNADKVLITGLLHHLNDDEVFSVLKLSKTILKTGGKILCIEPVFLMHQSKLARFVMSLDRGKNVRNENEWTHLFLQYFSDFESNIVTNLLRLPYTHILINAINK
jgi:ubiquinone/menaquinone biosynthesis C-methylase UbiE